MEGDKPAFLFKGFVNILIELLVIEGVESGILKNILSAHVFVISLVDIYVREELEVSILSRIKVLLCHGIELKNGYSGYRVGYVVTGRVDGYELPVILVYSTDNSEVSENTLEEKFILVISALRGGKENTPKRCGILCRHRRCP